MMEDLSRNIIKRWNSHRKGCQIAYMIAAAVIIVICLPGFNAVALLVAYAAALFIFRLIQFYRYPRQFLILAHTALLIALFAAVLMITGIHAGTIILALILEASYAAWLFLSDCWMRHQVAPSSAAGVGDNGTITAAVRSVPDLFTLRACFSDREEEQLLSFIDLYRIPTVLSDHPLSAELAKSLEDRGVIICMTGAGTSVPRYPGLEFVMPAD